MEKEGITYKFVRGKPFDGLEEYASAKVINVFNKFIEYPTQLELAGFERNHPKDGLKVRLGYYFERLVQGIQGGTIQDPRELNELKNPLISEPDITHLSTCCLREVKGVASGQALKIGDEQFAKYAHLQLGTHYSKPPKISFEIFRHGVTKVFKNFEGKSIDELVNALTLNVRSLCSLPFSVMAQIHGSGVPYTSRYEGDHWISITRFFSTGLNSMLSDPERTISEIGLNPEEYNIQRRKFPTGIKMNGLEIFSFPILIVEDKDHAKWLSEFSQGRGQYYLNYLKKLQSNQSGLGPLFEAEGGMALETDDGGKINFNPEELERPVLVYTSHNEPNSF
jgi:hypothetical protein